MSAAVALDDAIEIDQYEAAVARFLRGELDEERFTAIRLQHGIYGQRQEDTQMVRIKVPGGFLTPARLRIIGEVVDRYSTIDFASITTRQDVQLHFVSLKHTPAVMRRLAQVGLTTREACGNTVRNITACPLAGLCPKEHADVGPVVAQTARYFLRHPLTQHLPRKFKISMSGCEADCAQGLFHDVAVVAVRRSGEWGFRVMAGGGLGHKPRQAMVIEPFIGQDQLAASLEAVLRVHHRYSDRRKRAKSRIKFLVERFGEQGFQEKYREELAQIRDAVAASVSFDVAWRDSQPGEPCGPGAPRRVFAQRQHDRYVVPVATPLGDVKAHQWRGLAALMEEEGLDDVRTVQDQKLMIVGVAGAQLAPLRQKVAELGLAIPTAGDDVVACPGTWTCRLGITASREAAQRLSGGDLDLRVRVSGCHNGCAQPYVGDVGLHGEGRRVHGRLVPHYRLHLGGNGMGGGRLAVRGPEIPVARIEAALRRVRAAYDAQRDGQASFAAWAHARGSRFFSELLADLSQVGAEEVEAMARDFGDHEAFRVLQLGGGECAGVAQETVSAAFAEAAYERGYCGTFLRQRMVDQARECAAAALRRGGHALAVAAGQTPSDDWPGLAAALSAAGMSDDLAPALTELGAGLDRAGTDAAAVESLLPALDRWLEEARDRARAMDGQLHLHAAPPDGGGREVLDLSGEQCPMDFIKARMALAGIAHGQSLSIGFSSRKAAEMVSRSLQSIGFELLAMVMDGDAPTVTVRKPHGWVSPAQNKGALTAFEDQP